jgi:hypothetical protein
MPTGGIKGGPGDSLPPTKTVKISTVCVQPVVKNVINPIKSFLDIAVNLSPVFLTIERISSLKKYMKIL